MKENKKQPEEEMIEPEATYSEYEKIVTDKQWDDFLAWCRQQENGPHE